MTFSIGQNVIDIEIKALKLLKKSISRNQFETAVNFLYKTTGKIIISGIGKSGHIASKISSTLSSIGSSSLFFTSLRGQPWRPWYDYKKGLYDFNIKFWRKLRINKFNFIL